MRIPRKVKTKVVTSEGLDAKTLERFLDTYEGGTHIPWAGNCWLITGHETRNSTEGALHSFMMTAVPDDECP